MKRIIETIVAVVVLGVVTIGIFVGWSVKDTWRGEHTNMLIFGGFILLAVTVVVIGWVVHDGVAGAQRRRVDGELSDYARDNGYGMRNYAPPPQNQTPIDLMRYENARIQYERQRLALERDRQKALPQPAARDPLEDFYKGQEDFPHYFAQQSTGQTAQSLLSSDDSDSDDLW